MLVLLLLDKLHMHKCADGARPCRMLLDIQQCIASTLPRSESSSKQCKSTGFESAKELTMPFAKPSRPATIRRTASANFPMQAAPPSQAYTTLGHAFTGSPALCHSDLFIRSLDSGHPKMHRQQCSDSSLTCQTSTQQVQHQTSGSISGKASRLPKGELVHGLYY